MRYLTILIASTGLLAIGNTSAAAAATYSFSMNGAIVEQTHPGYPELIDGVTFFPPLYDIQIGDVVKFRARIDSRYVVDFGGGYKAAYLYAAPAGSRFELTLGKYSWIPQHEVFDGDPDFGIIDVTGERQLGAPTIMFKDGQIVGFAGWLIPVLSPKPLFQLGSDYMTGIYDPESLPPPGYELADPLTLMLSDLFSVDADPGFYENLYVGPSFNGIWNFADSSAATPEPASWAMMVAGFGLVGTSVRLRRRRAPA